MPGKWTLRRVADDEHSEHWPIDARAMIESGEFELVAPPADVVAALREIPSPDAEAQAAVTQPHPAGGEMVVTKKEDAGPAQPADLNPERSSGKKK